LCTTSTCSSRARVEQAAGYARLGRRDLYPQVNLLARGGGKLTEIRAVFKASAVFATGSSTCGRVRAGREAARLQYVSAELEAE